MRPSNRNKILEAAARVVQKEGVTSVTLDSVAAEAGVTKGGLLYHFSTRETLLLAIQQYLATIWEQKMLNVVGKPFDETTPQERVAAYAEVTTTDTTRAELLFMLETSTHDDFQVPWTDVLTRWTPPITENPSPEVVTQTIARLAAEGLWLHESLSGKRVSENTRRILTDRIIASITPEN